MQNQISLGRRERRQEFLYLLLLFLLLSTAIVWVIFRNSGNLIAPVSNLESAYMQQSKEFEARQADALPLYDTLFARITAYQNMPGNQIMESDITTNINTLNSLNENLSTKDARFVSFHQMAVYLKLYYEDVLILKKKKENIQRFQAQLSECEIGYKDGQTLLNQIKAAQAAKTNQ
ncbi:MAG: type VI secretion system TssO [Chitinophagaceae bacterium]